MPPGFVTAADAAAEVSVLAAPLVAVDAAALAAVDVVALAVVFAAVLAAVLAVVPVVPPPSGVAAPQAANTGTTSDISNIHANIFRLIANLLESTYLFCARTQSYQSERHAE